MAIGKMVRFLQRVTTDDVDTAQCAPDIHGVFYVVVMDY